MDYKIEDIELNEKLTELNLALPSGLTFIPENFETAKTIVEMDLEEASVVENPANKHCRTISIQVNGKSYDTLTLRTLDEDSDKVIKKV